MQAVALVVVVVVVVVGSADIGNIGACCRPWSLASRMIAPPTCATAEKISIGAVDGP